MKAKYTPETAFRISRDYSMIYNLRKKTISGRRVIPVTDVFVNVAASHLPTEIQKEIGLAIREALDKRFPVENPKEK